MKNSMVLQTMKTQKRRKGKVRSQTVTQPLKLMKLTRKMMKRKIVKLLAKMQRKKSKMLKFLTQQKVGGSQEWAANNIFLFGSLAVAAVAWKILAILNASTR